MITDAVLWVSHPDMMFERFAGLTILERQLFILARVGIQRIWIAAQKPKNLEKFSLRWPADVELFWVKPGEDTAVACVPPYVGMSGDHIIREKVLKKIISQSYDKPVAFQDADKIGVIQIIPKRPDNLISYTKIPLPANSSVLMQTPPNKGPALPWLLRGAMKDKDSFMARHFDRHISLTISRRLLNTWVKPNHITFMSTCIGLAGTSLLAAGNYNETLLGALIIWLHTLLDGCDGELARLRFQESRFGGFIDFWGDNIIHFVLFAALGIGQARITQDPTFEILGFIAALSALAAAIFVFRYSTAKSKKTSVGTPLFDGLDEAADNGEQRGGGLKKILASFEHMLAQRDFIYLFVVLAAIDRLDIFLWAAAIGSPLFLLIFLAIKK